MQMQDASTRQAFKKINVVVDDPLLKEAEPELLPGEQLWSVKVDGKLINVAARDRGHLVAKLRDLYPGANIGGSSEGRQEFSKGKKPNYNARVRMGQGVDVCPPMSRREAEKRNHQQQVNKNKAKKKGKGK